MRGAAPAVPALTPAPGAGALPALWVWERLGQRRTDAAWAAYFEGLAAAGVRAVLLQVYESTHARWASRILPSKEALLERLLPLVKAAGLDAHAWIHVLRCNVPQIMEHHPSWFSVSRSRKSSLTHPPYVAHYKWLCPSRPEVHDFVASIAEELAAFEQLDGIHLDFIRHPDVFLPPKLRQARGLPADVEVADYDFCYCDYCRAEFRACHGRDPGGQGDAEWAAYRCRAVSCIVSTIFRHREPKLLTAAVFPTPTLARRMVRQEWELWPLDGVMPMLYHSFYHAPVSWIAEAAAEGVAALAGRTSLYAGLLMSTLSAEEFARVDAAIPASGAAGMALFNPSAEDWKALRARAARGARWR